jgi:midasin
MRWVSTAATQPLPCNYYRAFTCVCPQIDLEAVFQREGEAPYQRLQQLLAGSSDPDACTAEALQMTPEDAEELEALRRALRGVVWTRSMRRMYTLVQR